MPEAWPSNEAHATREGFRVESFGFLASGVKQCANVFFKVAWMSCFRQVLRVYTQKAQNQSAKARAAYPKPEALNAQL